MFGNIASNGFMNGLTVLSTTPEGFSAISANFMALVVIAILIDASIAAIWYMIGVLINNQTVKRGARGEAVQVIGTSIIAGAILMVLMIFGLIYFNSVTQVGVAGATGTVLSPGTMSSICANLEKSAEVQFAASAVTVEGSNPNTGQQTPSVCDIINGVKSYQSSGGTGDVTNTLLMDYPLATTGVIMANLTNQVGTEINDTFVIDDYLGVLKDLKVTYGLCFQDPETASCSAFPFFGVPPIPFTEDYIAYYKIAWQPLAGLDMVTKSLGTMSTMFYLSLNSFLAQLLFIDIFIFVWPYLLFIGLVLRGFFFLRKLGGLFIAIAIGVVLFYPAIVSMEYLTSYNTAELPVSYPIGFCGVTSPYSYQLNFFNLPSIQGVAQDCGCWPSLGTLGSVSALWAGLNTPYFWGSDLVKTISDWVTGNAGNAQGAASQVGTFSIPLIGGGFASALAFGGIPVCNPGGYTPPSSTGGGYGGGGEGFAFSLSQVYGIVGVSSYFLPIINIIITLAAILGLSGLLGGDVQLAGLSRLV
ncbi:MAG: hypothetical protein M1504_01045 [Candidatus Marsarchaeota archaeon]|nr:hypothetical protein [Candidatus Marsarchaeota archaeon]